MTLIPGFETRDVEVDGVRIHVATGGQGAPLLLVHGHPQTHSTWRDIAPTLAEQYTVIAPDLRGYGDSDRPASDAEHQPYSKRVMAADLVGLMRQLGHERFAVVGHDRGGRVAHRMALDHPDAVERLAVLDIAPTATMYARTNQDFATRYYHWFFFIQPEPLPERLIEGEPEFFLRAQLAGQSATEGVPAADIAEEYLRCYRLPGTAHAICEDYRASAGIDLVHDAADRDAGRRLTQPLLALWGEKGTVGALYDVLDTWRDVSSAGVTGAALNCGHMVQEEQPTATLDQLLPFLRG
jgi:haloacetate dehalogenase